MTQPGANTDLTNPRVPGSPWWWLARLAQRLMDRQPTYDLRENYVVGNHPLPNGDRRFVKALRDLQDKAKTNYIALVTGSVTQKLRVQDFAFGSEGEVDTEARRFWKYNDMDYQAPVLLHDAATFGFSYALVSPPDEPGGPPVISMKDVRRCEIERDPNRPTKTLAGLEFWVNPAEDAALAILYLPDVIYYFRSQGVSAEDLIQEVGMGGMLGSINRFNIVSAAPNSLGVVPLERLDWRPEAGVHGASEAEDVYYIQDRMNTTVLHRLVVSNSQAYRQRWVSGGPAPKGGTNKPPWDPGADMIWITEDPNTKFGDFEQADIGQILEAIRDDVGDMAAVSQTPATALTNRMVNIAEGTVQQVLRGHHDKVRLRQDSSGFFFERLVKLCYRYLGNLDKATDVDAQALWHPIEQKALAETSDAFQKFVASGVPLKLAMQKAGIFTNQEIEWAVAEAEKMKAEQEAREDQMMDKQLAAKASQSNSSPGG